MNETATTRLLEAVRQRTTTGSPYSVAKALGISSQRVYRYMSGQDEMQDDAAITRAAELIGEDPAALLAEFQAERTKSPVARDHWKRLAALARQHGGTVAALFIMLSATMSPKGYAQVLDSPALPYPSEQFSAVYYVKFLRRLLAKKRARWSRLSLHNPCHFDSPAQLPLFLSLDTPRAHAAH